MRCNRLAILSTVLLSIGCAYLPDIAKPKVNSVKPNITGADLQGLDLRLDITIYNPYPTTISAEKLKYKLDVGGAELTNSETDAAVSIPPTSHGTMTLPLRVAFKEIMKVYKSAENQAEVPYKFTGSAVLNAFGKPMEVPVSHSGELPIVRPPTFSDVKFDMSRSGLTSATIDVAAKITNPNAFEVGVDDLRYVLKLGDAELCSVTAASEGSIGPGQTKPFKLKGEVSGVQAVKQLMQGGKLGKAQIVTTGAFKTPYGSVKP